MSPAPDAVRSDDLAVRLPVQQRSRDAWDRILAAGVAIVEDGGYSAFTIAAVCDRAAVAPRAVYERVNTKDGLFLAVYERKMAEVSAERDELFGGDAWDAFDAERRVREAVGAMVNTFAPHVAFLRSVILVSGVHPEIYLRGGELARDLGASFAGALAAARSEIAHADPDAAIRTAYETAFSALVIRTSYGPEFLGPAVDDRQFTANLADMVTSFLLRAA